MADYYQNNYAFPIWSPSHTQRNIFPAYTLSLWGKKKKPVSFILQLRTRHNNDEHPHLLFFNLYSARQALMGHFQWQFLPRRGLWGAQVTLELAPNLNSSCNPAYSCNAPFSIFASVHYSVTLDTPALLANYNKKSLEKNLGNRMQFCFQSIPWWIMLLIFTAMASNGDQKSQQKKASKLL